MIRTPPLMLAAVHSSPFITLPLAAVLIAWTAWYWRRLGEADVPETRRRIRRASMVVAFFAVLVLVRALSFVDPETDPSNYAVAWAMAISLLLLIVFVAFLDVLNNMRIYRADQRRAQAESRSRLTEAALDARRIRHETAPSAGRGSHKPDDGSSATQTQ